MSWVQRLVCWLGYGGIAVTLAGAVLGYFWLSAAGGGVMLLTLVLIVRLAPVRTAEGVARELAEGFADGSVVLPPDPPPTAVYVFDRGGTPPRIDPGSVYGTYDGA